MVKPVLARGRRLPVWPLVLAALGSAVIGLLAARTDYSFGPHEATYQVTMDSKITIDLGPLGSVEIGTGDIAQLKGKTGPLGMHITVHQIPSDLKIGDAGDVRDLLAGDLQAYVQLFADPGATIAIVLRRLALAAARYAGLTWLATAAVYMAGYLLLGPQRRREMARGLRRNWGWAAAGLVLVIGAGVALVQAQPRPAQARQEPLSALASTPLKGARVTGRLGGVLETYGGMAVKVFEDNNAFFAKASAAMTQALADLPKNPGGTTPVVMVSDLHCNIGLGPVTGAAASGLGATLIINGGDTTASGTSVESYCVDSLMRAMPKGSQMVVASGNHDSAETDKQEKAAGMVVLQGQPVQVQGFTFLGDSDPRYTGLGSGTVQKGAETIYDVGARMAGVAAEHPGEIDILLIHDPVAVRQTLEAGLAPLSLSGHLHRRVGPVQYGKGIMYVSSSTGRGVTQATNIGPLKDNAEITVFYFNPDTRRAVYYRLLTITPQAEVEVGELLPMPVVQEYSAFEGGMTPWPTGPASPTASPTATPAGPIGEGELPGAGLGPTTDPGLGQGQKDGLGQAPTQTATPAATPMPGQPAPLATIPEGDESY